MAGNHAILSPSAASRWLACTPSARFEEQIPETESEYASEGTLAHELAAYLLGNTATAKVPEHISFDTRYNLEMHDHCLDYWGFVRDIKGPEGKLLVEHTFDLNRFAPCSFGTADATVIRYKTLHVIDFKYGAGVRVSATYNPQMMLYALGALEKLKPNVDTVCMHIFQPRAGGASSYEISVDELLQWPDLDKARLAIAGGGDFVAGSHCQFCKARTRCKAFYNEFAALLEIYDAREITDAERTRVLTMGKLLSSWVKAIEEEVIKKLSDGETVPGFKLVNGRGRRSFNNEDAVVDILLGEGYESTQIFDAKLQSLDYQTKTGR